MENASKALLMAGGVLVGIILLSILSYMFINVGNVSGQYSEINHNQQLEEFNAKFTKYIGRDLNIYDVITLYNLQQTYKDKVIIIDKANIIKKLNDKNNIMTEENINNKYTCAITYKDGKVSTITIEAK